MQIFKSSRYDNVDFADEVLERAVLHPGQIYSTVIVEVASRDST